MTIKQLRRILDSALDENRNVYIPYTMIMPTSKSVKETTSNSIGHSFDDNNDLELYVVEEE